MEGVSKRSIHRTMAKCAPCLPHTGTLTLLLAGRSLAPCFLLQASLDVVGLVRCCFLLARSRAEEDARVYDDLLCSTKKQGCASTCKLMRRDRGGNLPSRAGSFDASIGLGLSPAEA